MNEHAKIYSDQGCAYPLKLEMDLRWKILVCEEKELIDAVNNYFSNLVVLRKEIEVIKSDILQVSIIISRKLMQLNGQKNFLAIDHLALANEMDHIGNIKDLKSFFCDYVLTTWANNRRLLKKKKAIVAAKNYINSNYHRNIILPDIAKMVQMSPTYFSRLFSKNMQYSFQDYLTHVRINFAKTILTNTNLSLEDIGILVGYYDVNYFIRVFKKTTGVTPGNFIKISRKKISLSKNNQNNIFKVEEPYSLESESILLWSILCRDIAAAEKNGKELIINLYRRGIDIHVMKSIILHLTIVLLRKSLQAGFSVENILSRTINLYREIMNANSYFEINVFLNSIISEIVKSNGNDRNYKQQIIAKIKLYIKENYSNNISLNDIANLVHLSPNYISRVFSQNTGMTLRRYLMKVRLQAAKNLLLNTELSVEEISCLVGYQDVSYFRKIFKQKLGITPGSLRLNVTNSNA